MDRFSDYRQIFTDVSKTTDGVGAAISCNTHNAKFKLHNNWTISKAELYAILEAVKFINKTNQRNYTIKTDSKNALCDIQNIYSSNPIHKDIYKDLQNDAKENKHVVLIWVPSHIGIHGNEVVDRLAHEAATSDGQVQLNKIVPSDLKLCLKNVVTCAWQNKWS
ncbi:uncharacterized protein [Diabrotica undecimpunctata]|uniref:uncharacterized protein n=1 Tax=Diabrotica undecimpunctata TaxID=50387 RepID=UPI003B640261